MDKKGPLILLGIGVGLALLVCVISVSLYGEIYFFNGYNITKIAWIVILGCIITGLIGFFTTGENICNRSVIRYITVSLCAFISFGVLSIVVGNLLNDSPKNNSYSGYSQDPDYVRNTYESCCTTAKHKQVLYSYDINNDNSISGYEMELFLNAHPRAVNDKAFVNWMKSKTG